MGIKKGSAVLLASAARTADPDNVEINANTVGISLEAISNMDIIVDVTAITATPSVTLTIQAQDPASEKFYDLLPSIVAFTATGTTVLRIGRDMVAAAGLAARAIIPEKVRLKFVHADADSITYSVGANFELDRSE